MCFAKALIRVAHAAFELLDRLSFPCYFTLIANSCVPVILWLVEIDNCSTSNLTPPQLLNGFVELAERIHRADRLEETPARELERLVNICHATDDRALDALLLEAQLIWVDIDVESPSWR